jgi:hypothetical protein
VSLRVVVSAANKDCPAHLALNAEGVDHDVVGHELSYAEQLAAWWRDGEGFVLVEHDVAPWPGAIGQLIGCPRDWCAYRFPKYQHLIRSLGCVKFSTRLVRIYPDLPYRWEGLAFNEFEGPMLSAIADVLRAESPDRKPVCEHSPPVAHVHRGEG